MEQFPITLVADTGGVSAVVLNSDQGAIFLGLQGVEDTKLRSFGIFHGDCLVLSGIVGPGKFRSAIFLELLLLACESPRTTILMLSGEELLWAQNLLRLFMGDQVVGDQGRHDFVRAFRGIAPPGILNITMEWRG